MLHQPLITALRPPLSSDRRTSQSGQQRSQGHCPRCHQCRQHPWHHFQCHSLQLHPRLPHQRHHLSTSVTPLVAGAQCRITTQHPCNHTQSVTLQAHGHPTSSTTLVNMVTATRTPKRRSPTSSLVGTHPNCARS